MAEVIPESPKRPAHWRWVTFTEPTPGRFDVCLPFTNGRIDAGILRAMKLAPATRTEGLSLKGALALGEKVEAWRAEQEARDPKGRRKRR